MVEHRRFGDLIPHLVLALGVVIMAFPLYVCFVASTHPQEVIANGQMPLLPGPVFWQTWTQTLLSGTSGTTRMPVGADMRTRN